MKEDNYIDDDIVTYIRDSNNRNVSKLFQIVNVKHVCLQKRKNQIVIIIKEKAIKSTFSFPHEYQGLCDLRFVQLA